jgi:acyl-CoA reductase-like NAD-dependent aldehyde dehydrogenase
MTTTIKNPITGNILYELKDPSSVELQKVMETARQMQPIIRAMSIEDRIKEVDKIMAYVLEHADFILDRIIEETGKARTDAYAAEVFEVCDVIDVYKKMAPKVLADKKLPVPIFLMGKKARQWKEPLGTIMVITPWNFPFYQVIVPALMAFLAGNSVVVKPSEVTPLQPLWKHFFEKSDFMKDAIQVVCGGKTVGAELIEMRPDKIHFTGSVRTGKKNHGTLC